MELLQLKLFAKSLVDVGGSSCGFQILKLCQISLLLPELHAIRCSQLTLIFLFQLVDGSRLDTLWRGQMEVCAHTTLVLNKLHHVMLHEWHAQNVDNLWTLLLILH